MTANIGAFVQSITESGFRVPEEVPVFAADPYYLGCTVYLYPSEADAERGTAVGGSGFLVGMPSRHSPHFYPHVVTNAHVIDSGCHYVRLASKTDEPAIVKTKPDDWVIAADDDLAVMGTYVPPNSEAVSIGVDLFLDEDCLIEGWPIYPGDEVFFYGRFIGHDGRQRNKPVMRFGNVAMLADPLTPIRINHRDQTAFLVECRSLSGFSGSPAFVKLSTTRLSAPNSNQQRTWIPGSAMKLLGIDCGHSPFWSRVYHQRDKSAPAHDRMFVETNSGIAVIVPAWRLKRLLYEERLVNEREAEEQRLDKMSSTVIAAVAESPTSSNNED